MRFLCCYRFYYCKHLLKLINVLTSDIYQKFIAYLFIRIKFCNQTKISPRKMAFLELCLSIREVSIDLLMLTGSRSARTNEKYF